MKLGHLEGEQPYLGVVSNPLTNWDDLPSRNKEDWCLESGVGEKNAVTFSWFWLSKPFFQLKKLKIPTEVFGVALGFPWGFNVWKGCTSNFSMDLIEILQ